MSRSRSTPRHSFEGVESAHCDSGARTTTRLHEERLNAVISQLLAANARSVLDLGCGEGDLLIRLAHQPGFERIVGVDISPEALAHARRSLELDAYKDDKRIELMHASFTEANENLRGFDAGVLLETIEHIDPNRLPLLEHAVFRCCRPLTVLITTPNQEYNVLHGMPPGARRHADHRFEWDRRRFKRWAFGIASRNGYEVRFDDIGPPDQNLGASTQMAIFRLTMSNSVQNFPD